MHQKRNRKGFKIIWMEKNPIRKGEECKEDYRYYISSPFRANALLKFLDNATALPSKFCMALERV